VSEGRVRVDFEGGEIIRTRELEQRIRTNLLHEVCVCMRAHACVRVRMRWCVLTACNMQPKPFRRVRGGGTFSEFPYMPTSVSPDVLFPKKGAAPGKSKGSKAAASSAAGSDASAAASSEAKPASRPASSPPPAARAPRRRASSEVRPRPSAPALSSTSKSSKSSGGGAKPAAPAKKRPSASDAGDDGSSTFLTQMST
jgi:hypothetical protein